MSSLYCHEICQLRYVVVEFLATDIAVGLERGPLSFVRINEELPERKGSGSGLEN
jgi:hypothetical protein